MEIINYNEQEINTKITAREGLLASLNKEIADKQATVALLCEERNQLQNTIKIAYESLPVIQAELDKVKNELIGAQVSLVNTSEQRDEVFKQKVSYETYVTELTKKLTELRFVKSALPVIQERYEEAKQQTYIHEARISDLRALANEQELRGAKLKAEIDAKIKENADRELTLNQREVQINKMTQELKERENALSMKMPEPKAMNIVPVTLIRHLEARIAELRLKTTAQKLIQNYKPI